MNAGKPNRRRWSLRGLVALVGSPVLVVALIVGVLAVTGSDSTRGSVAILGHKGLGYTLLDDESVHYSISGNATKSLYPGTSSTIDLSFTNPNSNSITVSARAVTITFTSPRDGCPVAPNFKVVHTLTVGVTIPGDSTETLSDLGVTSTDWPIIKMKDPSFTQDACAGMTLTLHYKAGSDD